MTEEERWSFLAQLDEELLRGGATLSEWCTFIVREADIAFAKGAYLASILTALAGIETYLRSEYGKEKNENLYRLIDQSPIDDDLKNCLHKLRKYRNKWVHVAEPNNDQIVLEHPERYERELEEMAHFTAKALRRVIYENPWT